MSGRIRCDNYNLRTMGIGRFMVWKNVGINYNNNKSKEARMGLLIRVMTGAHTHSLIN